MTNKNTKTAKLRNTEKALESFLKEHKYSSLREFKIPGKKKATKLLINSPWGDGSLAILLEKNVPELTKTLNSIYLPVRYSGIWHKDTKDFELIYTTYPIKIPDIINRKFKFRHDNKEYTCEFTNASSRLLEFSEAVIPIGDTTTDYRNLTAFWRYHSSMKENKLPTATEWTPISFWIRGIEWDEDKILHIVNHLNFYMSYYDTRCPTILIHSPNVNKCNPRTRYTAQEFPKIIVSKEIDTNLLHFWSATISSHSDPISVFLYYYKIIEYASFSYLDARVRNSVKRIMAAPNALDNIDKLSETVLHYLHQEDKLHENQKFENLLIDAVNPSILWREISLNMDSFTTRTKFDGGFSIEAIGKEGWTEGDFAVGGMKVFSDSIRKIRNALSHGKDQGLSRDKTDKGPKSTAVITPTTQNFQRLEPWKSLIAAAAGEVVLYRDIL